MAYRPRSQAGSPQDTAYIYALCEPGTDRIRYIGQTVKRPEERLAQHIYELRSGANPTHGRNIWMRNLLAGGQEPTLRILHITDRAHADAMERAAIRTYRERGHDLTNVIHTPAHRSHVHNAMIALWSRRKSQHTSS